MSSTRMPPRFVPTLTEVVEFRDALVVGDLVPELPEPQTPPPVVLAVDRIESPLSGPATIGLPAEPALHLVAEAAPAESPAEPAARFEPQPTVAAVVTEDVPAFLLAASGGAVVNAAEPSALPAQAAGAAPMLDADHEEQIVHNVLAELQRRTDLMLEYRLREALNPILARLCDTLIKEAREDLAATLRDVVARAVAQELGRHRPK
ncbi:hypothetical protein [Aquabacterium sp.]|uniref:hypothetical protein n=1 Tax=Aquabacterium sp. TaxID=1872578 RepID=UPI0035ADD929